MLPIQRTIRRRARRGGALLLLLLAAGAAPAAAESVPPAPPAERPAPEERERIGNWRRREGGVQVLDALLEERIAQLRRSSPSFARAWEDLERSGVPVLIGTREQTRDVLPEEIRRSTAWAGMTLSWGEADGRLLRSAVSIRVQWLRELHASLGSPEAGFLRALDDLLVHEIYGHLVPTVQARSTRVRCEDPEPGQWLADSCVGRRELALRAERHQHGRGHPSREIHAAAQANRR